jgi:hypothetical protein
MPKWLKRLFRSVLTSSITVAFDIGRAAGHTAIDDNKDGSITNHEKRVAHEALDVAIDRVHKEIMEEL